MHTTPGLHAFALPRVLQRSIPARSPTEDEPASGRDPRTRRRQMFAMQHTQALRTFEAPPLSLLFTEPLRAVLDFCAGKVAVRPEPIGDGHPVMVYPGLGAGAITTAHLRGFLDQCGFKAY